MKIPRLTHVAAAALLAVAACKPDEGPAKPMAAGEPARRSATSFVHCVEGGNTGCVPSGLSHGGWDAFFLLGWLGAGSPTSILEALPKQLQEHADTKILQGRFVRDVERHAQSLRGAECNAAGVQELGPLIDQVMQVATQRLQALGLWGADLEQVVAGLAGEAREELGGGFLVSMQCKSDPYELYLGTSTDGTRHQVVGMMSVLPRFLGGDATERANVTQRLSARSLGLAGSSGSPIESGLVHRWLPIRLEEF